MIDTLGYDALLKWHKVNQEGALSGRHIRPAQIASLLKDLPEPFVVNLLGHSVQGREIHSVTIGSGSKRILGWSHMHGNEGTTTKALFDLFEFFLAEEDFAQAIFLQRYTLCFVPMLNPDGAERYTRLNANGIDLNRDAQDLAQPESRILKELYTSFNPHFCLNLHGQRTIFGVGSPPRAATLSFLSPSQDAERSVTPSRLKGMAVIAGVHDLLEKFIPRQIGRYDDGFNLDCVGDTLQSLDIPTVLFEAGHYSGDYARERTRALVFLSLIAVLDCIENEKTFKDFDQKGYFSIPENKKCFYDHIVRGLHDDSGKPMDVAVQYEELCIFETLEFLPRLAAVGDLSEFIGHQEHDGKGRAPTNVNLRTMMVGDPLPYLEFNENKTITFSLKRFNSL